MFVHPGTRGLGLEIFDEYYLWNAVANPVETAIAGAQMVMSGLFERHSQLRVLLAHGGGVLPALAGRLERAWHVRDESRRDLREGPQASVRRMYFDTVTHDDARFTSLVSFLGASHVLLGSDHPFDMGSDDPVAAVRTIGLTAADGQLVLGDNARSLFAQGGLAGPAPRAP